MTNPLNMIQITVARGRTVAAPKPGSLHGEMTIHAPGEKLFVTESDAQILIESGFAYRPGSPSAALVDFTSGPPTSIGDFP